MPWEGSWGFWQQLSKINRGQAQLPSKIILGIDQWNLLDQEP